MSCFFVASSTSMISCPTSVRRFSHMEAMGCLRWRKNVLPAPPAIAILTILDETMLILTSICSKTCQWV
jgi:hypothetical protein